MKWISRLIRRRDHDLDDEVASHLAMAVQDRIARGEDPQRAREAALREFGNVALVKDATRSVWAWVSLEQLLQDLRFGSRILTTAPALSATAVLLIALVIGGNTTIFSMIHTLVAKPAAGVEAEGLFLVELADRPGSSEFSYPEYRDYLAQTRSLRPLIGFGFERLTLGIGAGGYATMGTIVAPSYFETLGVRLARGRSFSVAEDRGEAPLAAVISHRVWRHQFQSAEDVIGRPITINGHAATVAGVAPLNFRGVFLGEMADVWVPLQAYHRIRGTEADLEDRARPRVIMVGPLADDVTEEEAEAEFVTVARRLQVDYPATNKNKVVQLTPYAMASGTLIGDRSEVFLAVFSIITLLTLIVVSANVANLMLARAVARQRETAVRQSLGASRVRIIRMLIAEGLAIAAMAWIVASVIAVATSKIFLALLPPGRAGVNLDPDFMPDWEVLGYAMLLAAAATLAFTLAPALRAWRQQVLPPLKAGEQGVAQGRSRASTALVVIQLAFSVVLLSSAGLAYRSVSLIHGMDLGFNSRDMLLLSINTATASTKDANLALLERVRHRMKAVPGVLAVSYIRGLPVTMGPSEYQVRTSAAQQPLVARRQVVGADYLHVLGVTMIAGRDFSTANSPSSKAVVIINQHLAETLWPGRSAIGQTILIGDQAQSAEVAGVTPNVLFEGFRRETRPHYVLVPDTQVPVPAVNPAFYIRHSGNLESVAPAVTRGVQDVDPAVPIADQRTMEEHMANMVEPFEIVAVLLTAFSAISIVIAAVGQYAAIAFDMRRRMREFGVRVALGASSRQVLGSVLREGLMLTAAGLALGFALSTATNGALASFLWGISATDMPTYAGVACVLAVSSLLACYLPARRAASVNPVEALRQE